MAEEQPRRIVLRVGGTVAEVQRTRLGALWRHGSTASPHGPILWSTWTWAPSVRRAIRAAMHRLHPWT